MLKLVVIDLSKQQKLDADPKAMQQISFTRNLKKCKTIFHYWRTERNGFRFFKRNS